MVNTRTSCSYVRPSLPLCLFIHKLIGLGALTRPKLRQLFTLPIFWFCFERPYFEWTDASCVNQKDGTEAASRLIWQEKSIGRGHFVVPWLDPSLTRRGIFNDPKGPRLDLSNTSKWLRVLEDSKWYHLSWLVHSARGIKRAHLARVDKTETMAFGEIIPFHFENGLLSIYISKDMTTPSQMILRDMVTIFQSP